MNGNFINDATRKAIEQLKFEKPKSFWHSPAIPTFAMSVGCSIWLFYSNETIAFCLSGIWVMILSLKIAIDLRIHRLKMEFYHGVIRMRETILTPVYSEDGEAKIFNFVAPSAQFAARITALTNYFSKNG